MSTVSEGAPGGRGFGSVIGGGAGSVTGATTLFVLLMSVAIVKFGGDAQRVLLSGTLALSFYAVISSAPRIGIPGILIFLNFIGMLRRYSVPILGYSSLDALLLITPIVTALFLLNQLLGRSIQTDTRLSKLVGWLVLVMLVQVFNPFQGGVVLGLMGVISFTVPLAWYYLGRTFGSRAFLYQILNIVIIVSAISAAYGLWQTFFGFTDVEKQWFAITRTDIGQAVTDDFVRVFATYSSFAEYTRMTTVGACACLGLMRRNRLYVIPFLLFATSVLLSSSRGSLLGLVAATAYVWAVQGKTLRSWVPRLAIAVSFGIGALFFGLSSATENRPTKGAVNIVIGHQAKGILEIGDNSKSTAGGHLQLGLSGIVSGFTNPLGYGVGAATVHAVAYTDKAVGTEGDITNMFGSLGFIGGGLYLYIVIYSCYMVGVMWHRYRDPAVLATLAILLSCVGSWLIAGQYILPFILFMLIGMIDKFYKVDMDMSKKAKMPSGVTRSGRQGTEYTLSARDNISA